MNLTRTLALAGLASLAGAIVVAAPAAAEPPAIVWAACPDAVTNTDRVPPEDVDQYRALVSTLQCGTLRVPLDYRRPNGRSITIGFTRLPAADHAHRQGALAVNPGGPGGSGYLMPLELAMSPTTAGLHDTYDMIGLDPRGVGYSTRATCEEPQSLAAANRPDAPTRDEALEMYNAMVAGNRECLAHQGEFLRQVTTENISRDLDAVRAGLGERRISFLGVSWGTWFGAVYRSLFPARVDRMWIDSTAPPRFYGDQFITARSTATEAGADRMTAWLAEHDDVYRFGTTAAAVKAALLALEQSLTDHPRVFTDLPKPVDAMVVALSTAQPSPVWPLAALVMTELRDSHDGTPAPLHVKAVLGGDDRGDDTPPPADAPQDFNDVMNHAAICNEDFGRRDFDTAWDTYQQLRELPLTGMLARFGADCAGWDPVRPVNLRYSPGSLVLSGHRDESVSVYPWTIEMQHAIGGTVLTVNDDVHGSVPRTQDCSNLLVGYFRTGVLSARHCEGEGENPDPSEVRD
ncbi:pimeloyl-ACP methyl ester carboxylesterase [Hamadaea flava]|uniref:Alpha/beta fold hydrolase n=1 Tax=Hamadaea flava TaxID=1742688 RepID=A0ABV8LZP0_9ACTN|nr:alpha/beta fold hydrolase [Hamadaea flava]MCP2329343.1 pimeloyl-ACP methyl ester carboxylesterase [Hamadaea flava]